MHRETARYKKLYAVKASPEDLLGRYLQEIGQYRLLDSKDEQALFRRINNGLAVYQQLEGLDHATPEQEQALIGLASAYQIVYSCNLRLVVQVAKKYAVYNTLALIDAIQEGNLGLDIAARRFDITTGYKFSTYATWWIRSTVTRAIANTARTIRMPVHEHDQWIKMLRATNKLDQKLGREPTIKEIAVAIGLKPKRVEELRRKGMIHLRSLNQPTGEEGDEFGDFIPDSDEAEREAIFDKQQVEQIFSQACLNPKTAVVLSLRFGTYIEKLSGIKIATQDGVKDYDEIMKPLTLARGLTLDEVGEIFGISRERVRQIESTGLDTIRQRLGVPTHEAADST